MKSVNSLAELAGHSIARQAVVVAAGVALLTAMSQVSVPMYPVPMTLQTLAVMLIGLTMGGRLAATTIVSYLALGAAGAPVFAGFAGGAQHLAGPTAGFLLGFLAAAALIGLATDRGITKGWVGAFAAVALSTIVLFALGFAWLGTMIGFDKAWQFGVAPFIIGDAIKVVLAVLIGKGVLKGAEGLARL